MTPRVSIIIPCYNQGFYILETLESLKKCDSSQFETIIVNDGSKDQSTIEILSNLKKEGFNVIFQENKGLAAARNTGIQNSSGEFILPLDSDNLIRPDFIGKALKMMDSDKSIGVVYSNAQFFGTKSGTWKPGPFNMQKLMITNYIDACALIRRKVLEEVGQYDTGMTYMGWEDWDLWLRICFANYKFHYIDETLWDYRVAQNSMAKEVYNNYQKPNHLENYIASKYPDKMGQNYIVEHIVRRFKSSPFLFLVKLLMRSYLPKMYFKYLERNKIRNGL